MNTTARNTITEMTNLLGQASYDVDWGYRSSLDAATDLLADPRFEILGLNHYEMTRLIGVARTEGQETTEEILTEAIRTACGAYAGI